MVVLSWIGATVVLFLILFLIFLAATKLLSYFVKM